jgi:hypothetical protein
MPGKSTNFSAGAETKVFMQSEHRIKMVIITLNLNALISEDMHAAN